MQVLVESSWGGGKVAYVRHGGVTRGYTERGAPGEYQIVWLAEGDPPRPIHDLNDLRACLSLGKGAVKPIEPLAFARVLAILLKLGMLLEGESDTFSDLIPRSMVQRPSVISNVLTFDTVRRTNSGLEVIRTTFDLTTLSVASVRIG